VHELFEACDIVYSYYSTVVLEALQFHKPVVLYSAQSLEKEQIRFHFRRYADMGAVLIAKEASDVAELLTGLQDEHLRSNLAQKAQQANEAYFSFDGMASQRILELIRTLAK